MKFLAITLSSFRTSFAMGFTADAENSHPQFRGAGRQCASGASYSNSFLPFIRYASYLKLYESLRRMVSSYFFIRMEPLNNSSIIGLLF